MGVHEGILLIVPVFAMVLYLFRYLKSKDRMNIFAYFFFALYPFVSSNFSSPIYRNFGKVCISAGFAFWLIHYMVSRKREKLIINPYLLLLFVVILCSYAFAVDKESFWNGFTNFSFIVAGYLFISNVVRRQDFDEIIKMFHTNGILLSLVAVGEFALTHSRVEATFSNANYLGMYLLISFIAVFYGKKSKKSLFLISLAVLLTGSRAAILGLLIPFLVARKIKIRYVFMAALLFFGALKFGMLDRFQSDAGASSNNDRQVVVQVVKEIFTEHPLTGIGYNNFLTQFVEYLPFTNVLFYDGGIFAREDMATHNDYLRVLAELGLIGLIPFLLYLWKGFRDIRHLENKHLYYSILYAYLFYSMTHNNINSIDFWIFTSMATFMRFKTEPIPIKEARKRVNLSRIPKTI